MSVHPQKQKRGLKRLKRGTLRKISRPKTGAVACPTQSLPAVRPDMDNLLPFPDARIHDQVQSKSGWSVIRLVNEQDGRLSFLACFPDGQGLERTLELGNELSPAQMRKALQCYTTTLPSNSRDAIAFIEDLIRTAPPQPVIKATQPGWKKVSRPDQGTSGFRPDAFATPGQIIPRGCNRLRWATAESGPHLGQTSGSLRERNGLLARFALLSRYVAFAEMTALASTLLPFIRLSESAVFNFVGKSSTGKTTALKAGMSIQGHPQDFHCWDTTPRALEEQAAAHNHVLFGMNAAERNVGKYRCEIFKRMSHGVPEGRSMGRSDSVQDRVRNLSWSNMTLSTSNNTGAQMAAELGLTWGDQEAVRFIDIPVPEAHEGGIFDRPEHSQPDFQTAPEDLIRQLEAALDRNYGVLLGPWIEHLSATDPTQRIEELTQRFLKGVKPRPGVEERIARKFALVYAAGRMAVDAGLLPWPEDYPFQVTVRLYRRAYNQRTAGQKDLQSELLRFRQMVHTPAYVPTISAEQTIEEQADQTLLGVRTVHKKVAVIAIRREGVVALFNASAKAILRWLNTSGAVMDGHGSRSGRQLPIRLRLDGRRIGKPRFLVLRADHLENALSQL